MTETETVEVRAKLHARLEEIAEDEGMGVEDLVDHALRTYAEAFEGEDDEAEEQEN